WMCGEGIGADGIVERLVSDKSRNIQQPIQRLNLTGEDAADDVFDGDFFDVEVLHRQLVEQGFADRDHAVALYFEFYTVRIILRNDLTIAGQLLGRAGGCPG